MTTPEYKQADPDTLDGLLQRGRGEGYRRALLDPSRATDVVIHCIAVDPRWDHQVESRNWFYASLVAELGIDLARLRVSSVHPPARSGDAAARITTRVLELSAKRGIPGAVEQLRLYLRSNRDPEQALHSLLPFAGQVEEAPLLQEILEHADERQIADALWVVHDLDAAPWPDWRRASSIINSAVLAETGRRAELRSGSGGSSPKRDNAMRARLIKEAGSAPAWTPLARLAALDVDDDVLLEVAATLLDDPTQKGIVRTAIRHTLWRLNTSKALDWARLTASENTESGSAALNLLTKLAEAVDVPQLRSFLEWAIAEGRGGIYTQCALVEALGRLRDASSIPAFKLLFNTTVYSYLRGMCAVALSRTDPNFPSGSALECLWDCESGTRLLAINAAEVTSEIVRKRLTQMAGDVTEGRQCRLAAAGALQAATR